MKRASRPGIVNLAVYHAGLAADAEGSVIENAYSLRGKLLGHAAKSRADAGGKEQSAPGGHL
jgi:hypothetical protein